VRLKAQIWLLIEQAALDVEDEAAAKLLQRLEDFRMPARRFLLLPVSGCSLFASTR
jgi:hypothetical protein